MAIIQPRLSRLKREAQWKWYKYLCHLQKHPITEMFYDIELIKPNGKVADKVHGRAESYVRNFYNFLAQNMLQVQPSTYSHGAYGDGSLMLKDTSGDDKSVQAKWAAANSIEDLPYGYRNAAASATHGIVFEDVDTAYTFEQTAPVSAIANGTGVGQLVYGDTFTPYLTYDAGSDLWTCIWERMALNNEAATQVSVEVKSIALIGRAVSSTAFYFMFARDVLVSTITVPYGIQIKGRWTLTHER